MLSRLGFWLLLVLMIAYTLGPFLWIVLSSAKSEEELNSIPPILPHDYLARWGDFSKEVGNYFHDKRQELPSPPLPGNYRSVFRVLPFARFLLNSCIVAGITTILCLLIGALAAYALARMNFWWKPLVLMLTLSIAMFPQISTVTPLFIMIRWLGIFNTHLALIIPYTTFALPLSIWILTSFFQQIPKELEQAALMDGLSRLAILRKVFLPLALPAIATTGILVFIFCWNEFLFALCFTSSEIAQTVPVGITMFEGQYQQPWGEIAAASVLVTLPLVLLTFLFQRKILSGLTAGAVKE